MGCACPMTLVELELEKLENIRHIADTEDEKAPVGKAIQRRRQRATDWPGHPWPC